MERRVSGGCEARVEERDGKKVISGYGAVFHREGDAGTEYTVGDWFTERIGRTAFDRAIKEKHDAAGLFNHDPNNVLGRTSSGTMRLSVDDRGLKYEIDVPDTQAGRDVATSIARGDVRGSSFAFRVTKETWEQRKDKPDLRVIEDLDLFDTGPVVYPAYGGTSTGIRADDSTEALAARDAWRAKLEQEQVAIRTRIISLDNDLHLA